MYKKRETLVYDLSNSQRAEINYSCGNKDLTLAIPRDAKRLEVAVVEDWFGFKFDNSRPTVVKVCNGNYQNFIDQCNSQFTPANPTE